MRSNKTGWLMLAPMLIILGTFGIMPFFYVPFVAFHQWNPFGASPEMVYNGAKNFRRLVFDKEFLLSVGLTLKFAFFAVGSEIVVGYLLAQLLMKDFPGKAIFRTVHTLPLIVAPIVVGSVWRLMTTPSIGIIPRLLQLAGLRHEHSPRCQCSLYPDRSDGSVALDAPRHSDAVGGLVGAAQRPVRTGGN